MSIVIAERGRRLLAGLWLLLLPWAARAGSFHAEDVRFAGATAEVQLAATLTVPDGGPSARHAAVLLIHGTGLLDRDETIANHRPFRTIAEALSTAGYVVLRYDKRGAGESTGPVDALQLADLAADAEAAFDWLRARQEVDPRRVMLLGHSEGGLIAPMIAARRPEVSALVLLSAPTIRGLDLALYQTRQGVLDRDRGEDEAARAVASAQRLFEIVRSQAPGSERDEALRERLEAERESRGLSQRFVDDQLRSLTLPWLRAMLDYDPLPTLKAVRQPVLMLYGALDHQVPPALNAGPAREALKGHKGSVVQVLPSLNHLLFRARTGAVSEYATIIGGVDDTALSAIRRWLDARPANDGGPPGARVR